MSETHSLRVEIDAAAAKRGSADYVAAINKIGTATTNMVQSADSALSRLERRIGNLNFANISRAVSAINAMKLSPGLATGMDSLARAFNNFSGVNSGAIASVNNLMRALQNFNGVRGSTVSQITALSQALSGFRAPTAAQANNFNTFVNSLSSLRAPAGIQSTISSLQQLTATMVSLRAAMHGMPNFIRIPSVGGGGAGWTRAYGGNLRQGNAAIPPWMGLGPGRSSMAGMRGLENQFSLPYQLGSVGRTAIGALTAGNFLTNLVSATEDTQKFEVAMQALGLESGRTQRLIDRFNGSVRENGLNINIAREGYAGLQHALAPVGVSAERVADLFENSAVIMRNMGMDNTAQSGALRALGQMFSKGRIMSEELFQQMAEHWRGFPAMVADAVGLTLPQLRERMEREALNPQVAVRAIERRRWQMERDSISREESGDGTIRMSANINRLRTEWQALLSDLGKGEVGNAISDQLVRLREIIASPEFRDFATRLGKGLAEAVRAVGDAAVWASQNLDTIGTALKVFVAIGAINMVGGLAGSIANLVRPMIALGGTLISLLPSWTAFTNFGASVATRFTAFGQTLAGVGARAVTFATNLSGPVVAGLAVAGVAAVEFGRDILQVLDKLEKETGQSFTFGEYLSAGMSLARQGIEATVNYFNEKWTSATTWLSDSFAAVFSGLKDVFKNAWDSISSYFTDSALGRFLTRASSINLSSIMAPDSPVSMLLMAYNGINNVVQQTGQAAATAGPSGAATAVAGALHAEATRQRQERDRVAEANRAEAERRASETAAETAARRQAERDRRRAALGTEPGRMDPNQAFTPRPDRNAGARAERLRERFEDFRAQMDAEYRITERLGDGMKMIREARARGQITDVEAADVQQRLRDNLLESVGAIDPMVRAQRQLNEVTAIANGLQREGIMTQEQRDAVVERTTQRLRDNLNPYENQLRLLREESELLGMNSRQMETEQQVRRITNELRERGRVLTEAETAALRAQVQANRDAQQAQRDREEGLSSWANSFRSIDVELRKLESTIANNLTDAIAEFVTTGKADFNSFAQSVVRDINKLIIQQGIRELLQYLGVIQGNTTSGFTPGNMGGGSGGLISGVAGLLGLGGASGGQFSFGKLASSLFGSGSTGGGAKSDFSAVGEMIGGSGASGGGFFSQIGSFLSGLFKEGGMVGNPVASGVMPAHAFANAPHYAQGTANTTGGIPAVLHPNEAVIPLSRNRRVPIEMKGGGGSATNIQFNITTPDANSFRKSQGQISRDLGAVMQRNLRRNG